MSIDGEKEFKRTFSLYPFCYMPIMVPGPQWSAMELLHFSVALCSSSLTGVQNRSTSVNWAVEGWGDTGEVSGSPVCSMQ